jgi:V-type H+-transporting ATPase subunit d
VKLQLSSTDYGNFLQNEPSPLSTSTIADKCLEHLVNEFDYVRAYSVQPLTKFLDYITCVGLPMLRTARSDLTNLLNTGTAT